MIEDKLEALGLLSVANLPLPELLLAPHLSLHRLLPRAPGCHDRSAFDCLVVILLFVLCERQGLFHLSLPPHRLLLPSERLSRMFFV